MPIACMACGGPVHENAVKCPHCGDRTGAVPTKPTAAEAAAIARIEEARFYNAVEQAAGRPRTRLLPVTGALGAIGLVAEVFAATARTLDEPLPPPPPVAPRPPAPAVPPAVARERPPRPPTVEPLPSQAPEPAPPPADQPRFLK